MPVLAMLPKPEVLKTPHALTALKEGNAKGSVYWISFRGKPADAFLGAEKPLLPVEVLQNVFFLATSGTAASAARACRRWAHIALPRVWRDLTDLRPLYSLICPLEPFADDEYKEYWRLSMAYDFSDTDWTRVFWYGNFVRTISITHINISPNTISRIALASPYGLTPNLRCQSWVIRRRDDVMSIMPFLSPSTKRLSISFHEEVPASSLNGFFRSAMKLQGLNNLTLSCLQPIDLVSKALASWLSHMVALQGVDLPPFYHSSEVIGTLGALPLLRSLRTCWPTTQNASATGMNFSWLMYPPGRPHPQIEAFGSLEELALEGPATRLCHLFSTFPEQCKRLTYLGVTGLDISGDAELGGITAKVAQTCSSLQTLILNLYEPFKFGGDNDYVQLSFAPLRPLLKCTSLRHLYVHHNSAILLADQDLADMGMAWPHLASLLITPDPDLVGRGQHTILGNPTNIVYAAAVALPRLQTFGVFCLGLDRANPPDPTRYMIDTTNWDVRNLYLGLSSIHPSDVMTLGLLLGSVCSPQLQITDGASSLYLSHGGPLMHSNGALWSEIQKLARTIALSKIPVRRLLDGIFGLAEADCGKGE